MHVVAHRDLLRSLEVLGNTQSFGHQIQELHLRMADLIRFVVLCAMQASCMCRQDGACTGVDA